MTSRPDRSRRAEGAAWALTLLVTLSSLAFAAGAVIGWTLDLWPATPVTLGVAAVAVLGGPALATALTLAIRAHAPARPEPAPAPRRPAPLPVAPPPAPAPGPVVSHALSPKAARARELLDWRDAPRRRTRA